MIGAILLGLIWVVFLGLGFLIQSGVIWGLKRLKGYYHIYRLSPESHQHKAPALSFGGVGVFLTIFVGMIYFGLMSRVVLWCFAVAGCFGAVGFIDDLLSYLHQKNKGLGGWLKFGFQTVVACFFIGVFHYLFRPLSLIEMGLYWFILVGTVNATNITDGLDGLLSGTAIVSFVGFGLYFFSQLQTDLAFLNGVIIISLLIFLKYNFRPAKIYLGDTGSLMIGGFLAAFTMVLDQPIILVLLGGIYIVETLSVIIQVGWYKYKRKRVFLMAPIHHHFEMKGYSELQIVFMFWLIQVGLLGVFLVTKGVL